MPRNAASWRCNDHHRTGPSELVLPSPEEILLVFKLVPILDQIKRMNGPDRFKSSLTLANVTLFSQAGQRPGANRHHPIVIKRPKTFHIQSIPGIFATQMIRDEQWDSDEGVLLDGAISQ